MSEVWGSLIVLMICPLIGGLPLIEWITYTLTRRRLSNLGTRNISVSAAFYHGGRLAGILAVISEASKGIIAVLLTRAFFPAGSVWELLALIALVMGRYWMGKGAGTTNVLWGLLVHDPIATVLIVIMGLMSFTIFRNRTSGRLIGLFLLAFILTLSHPSEFEYIIAAFSLAALLAGIYQKIPDDLDLPDKGVNTESRKVFRFFRGDNSLLSLNDNLESQKVGQKAATLAQLKRLGYPIPDGWVLPAGDDPQPLLDLLEPSVRNSLVVRSSAVGEDSENASAAGQYTTILNIIDKATLQSAILTCQTSYNTLTAIQYRQDRQQKDTLIAVLVQKQIKGVFSGVAFSRDPVNQLNTDVVVEALPGDASRVVSGKVTPEQYQVAISGNEEDYQVRGSGDVPVSLIKAVATLTRELETLYQGIPQDIEWTYDGQQLWLLQTRSITNLQPIWTRKIAAEVIPGIIRPLTWSINCPLTCGVWGDIFTLVLGKRAKDLDFNQTATLHYQRAYFNATLLGTIFRRMGLPPESLEFLTRGASFSKPPLFTTLRNLPGLLRLLRREWRLETDFQSDKQRYFTPILNQLKAQDLNDLSEQDLLWQIETILAVLSKITYYSILAPLSFALRQAITKVPSEALNNSESPEIASLESLASLATDVRHLLPMDTLQVESYASLFTHLSEMTEGKSILDCFGQWLDKYGYLSDVATDIAVPRWKEDPRPVKELFTQYLLNEIPVNLSQNHSYPNNRKTRSLQKRLNLKNRVTAIYSRFLAQLRDNFLALETILLSKEILSQAGDIFFLEYSEIQDLVQSSSQNSEQLSQRLQQRRLQYEQNQSIINIPYLIYGNSPAFKAILSPHLSSKRQLQGIGASSGQVEGRVRIVRRLQDLGVIDPQTILVVPYTDSGWAPLLSRAAGIIAEVGGKLSHGAIIAREYGIPAVMDIENATVLLRDGQRVRIDGQKGIVEIVE